jgi:hypothetical protein
LIALYWQIALEKKQVQFLGRRILLLAEPVSSENRSILVLLGNNLEELDKAKEMLFEELDNFSTLKDVAISNQEGRRREINITLKPKAYSLGLTLRDVAQPG